MILIEFEYVSMLNNCDSGTGSHDNLQKTSALINEFSLEGESLMIHRMAGC